MKRITIQTDSSFFFVLTSKDSPQHHHGFQINPSTYVVTRSPSPGDFIKYILPGTITEEYKVINGELTLESKMAIISLFSEGQGLSRHQVKLRVLSHSGRSPMLGEDTLDEAFGNDCLRDMWIEQLNGCSWQYAACEVEEIPEPDRKGDKQAWMRWRHDEEIEARWDYNTWTLVDTSDGLDQKIMRIILENARQEAVGRMRDRVSLLLEDEVFQLLEKIQPLIDQSSKAWINQMCQDYKMGSRNFRAVQNSVSWILFKSRLNFRDDSNLILSVYKDASVNPEPEVENSEILINKLKAN